MAKTKNPGRRSGKKTAGAGSDETGQGARGPSPSAEQRLNIRLNGGVDARDDRVGPERKLAEQGGDMVTVPRLDHTLIDNLYGRGKIYPSEEPVEIPRYLAVTYGLVGLDAGVSSGRITGQSLITEDDSKGADAADDNGTGGTGAPVGTAIPASSVADQAPTLDEINEAATAAGRDAEQVLAAREAEIKARREARVGNE